MTSKEKVLKIHPTAYLERGYANIENRIVIGGKRVTESFSRPRNAWAAAWRYVVRERKEGK